MEYSLTKTEHMLANVAECLNPCSNGILSDPKDEVQRSEMVES